MDYKTDGIILREEESDKEKERKEEKERCKVMGGRKCRGRDTSGSGGNVRGEEREQEEGTTRRKRQRIERKEETERM